MVDSIHGNKGPGPLKSLKATRAADAAKGKPESGKTAQADFAAALQKADKTASTQNVQGSVKTTGAQIPTGVVFSPVNQDLAKASETVDAERAAKVQDLKQQVAEGNYQPDLKKVAASLLHFIARES